MKPHTKAATAGLAVCAIALPPLASLLLTGSESSPVGAPEATSVPSRPEARPGAQGVVASVAPAFASRVGIVTEHAFRFASELVQGGRLSARLRAGGQRRAACYRKNATGSVVGVRFRVTQLDLAGLRPEVAAEVRAGLKARCEVLLDLDPQGALRGLALVDPPASPLVRDQLRSWATYPHLVGAASDDRSWSAPGWDALGEARDSYRRDGEIVERKRRLASSTLISPRLEGSLRGQVRGGRVVAVAGRETVRFDLGRVAASSTRETWLELQRVRSLSAVRLEQRQALLDVVTWERSLVTEAEAVERAAQPLTELLPALRAGKGSLRALARSLRSAPRALGEALRVFPSLPVAGQRRLLSALGAADTLASQRALLGLAASLPDALVPTAFAALGRVQFPFPETIDFLRDQSRRDGGERQRWGTLGLGLVARSAAEEDAANRAAIHLQENLETQGGEQSRSMRLVTLSALGNGGREVSFEGVAPHALDGDAEVRARALFALRDVDVEEAQLLLTGGALHDPSATVRREAVHGLALRGPTPGAVEALAQVLRSDAVAQVRVEAVDGLVSWLTVRRADVEPEVAASLRALLVEAQRDRSEAVRDAAQAGLRG